MLVKEIMKKPIVIDQDITLSKASKVLTRYNISSIIMVKGEKFIGVLTEQDLIKHFGEKNKVSKIMRKNVVSITPSSRASRAIKLMKDNDLKILPVVKAGKLVGVVGERDLLNKSGSEDNFLIN